jgi:HD superfamily phosphohydrolase
MNRILLLFLFLPLTLIARPLDTFYGTIEVDEPVLLELIDSEPMQRLKKVHQYGVSYYTSHNEEYTRYDHSVGVFVLLRTHGASLREQIAGLLHDVSHTVFSHVGDWVFGHENQEKDYQNKIHAQFMEERGIGAILRKHGYTVEEVQPTKELCPALECPLPRLCADRIDYNIQGSYHRGFLSYEEVIEIFNSLEFADDQWVANNADLFKKLARYSYFMSADCWGSPRNHLQSQWLADILIRACELDHLTLEDIHYGVDEDVWERLHCIKEPLIQAKMWLLEHTDEIYTHAPRGEEDLLVRSKFRGIDPLIKTGDGIMSLTAYDPVINAEFEAGKHRHEAGWPISLTLPHNLDTVLKVSEMR